MKRIGVLVAILALGLAAGGAAHAKGMKLSSANLKAGGTVANEQVYKGFGCTGDNISPALSWSGAPAKTKSFALTVYDPDAPTGSGWWHWVVFNIPAEMTSLPEGAGELKNGLIPEAVQVRNDYGHPGYGGACPPKGGGDHRYQFRIYALKVEQLPLDFNATPAQVGFQVNANKLAEADLEVLWGH
jgi:Raf kinase inhibitor-like YbhB/YbcL family protein